MPTIRLIIIIINLRVTKKDSNLTWRKLPVKNKITTITAIAFVLSASMAFAGTQNTATVFCPSLQAVESYVQANVSHLNGMYYPNANLDGQSWSVAVSGQQMGRQGSALASGPLLFGFDPTTMDLPWVGKATILQSNNLMDCAYHVNHVPLTLDLSQYKPSKPAALGQWVQTQHGYKCNGSIESCAFIVG